MGRAEEISDAVAPALGALGLELVGVELRGQGKGQVLRLVIDRDGGIDLDAIAAASQAVSPVLDQGPAPSGPYALEVSSPGLERPLRTPAHFLRALGATVTVKTRDDEGAARRVRGVLASADDDGITVDPADGSSVHLRYDEVRQARTVFEWDTASKGGRGTKQTAAATTSETR